MQACCVLFSRNIFSTNSKTRIRDSGNYSENFINQLHTEMVLQTLETLNSHPEITLYGCWRSNLSKAEESLLSNQFPRIYNLVQTGNSFSERFQNALLMLKKLSPNHSILITGSDCPYLTVSVLQDAISNLNEGKIVIGPDSDNGFYLIAFPVNKQILDFEEVFKAENQIESICKNYADEDLHLLNSLADIDTSEDLEKFKSYIKSKEVADVLKPSRFLKFFGS
ncbi:MAG: DUF2064 domain-containing protein [Bdellovibrionota bacterium]